MSVIVLSENREYQIRRVFKKIGGGWTLNRALTLSVGMTVNESASAMIWVRNQSWSRNVYERRSRYPFLVLDTDTRMVNHELAKRLNAIGRKMQRLVWIGEGLRTRARQQELWDQYVRRNFARPLVARPGTSRHETGDAADTSIFLKGRSNPYTNIGSIPEARSLMRRHGLACNVPGEPWHCEISTIWRA
jgi:hypothetical protein